MEGLSISGTGCKVLDAVTLERVSLHTSVRGPAGDGWAGAGAGGHTSLPSKRATARCDASNATALSLTLNICAHRMSVATQGTFTAPTGSPAVIFPGRARMHLALVEREINLLGRQTAIEPHRHLLARHLVVHAHCELFQQRPCLGLAAGPPRRLHADQQACVSVAPRAPCTPYCAHTPSVRILSACGLTDVPELLPPLFASISASCCSSCWFSRQIWCAITRRTPGCV